MLKNKERVLTSALAVLLAAVMLAGTSHVYATPVGGAEAVRQYDGRFADVPEGSWYYDSVVTLYELGMTNGQSDTSYAPNSPVTVGEMIAFASRVHQFYFENSLRPIRLVEDGVELDWQQSAVGYLSQYDVIGRHEYDGRYNEEAPRGLTAVLMYKSVRPDEMKDINSGVVDKCYYNGTYIKDINSGVPYADAVLALYRWGILSGGDEWGSFKPNDSITRAELAAMLTRLLKPEQRLTLNWDTGKLNSASGTTYAGLIRGDSTYRKSHGIDDMEAIKSNVNFMISKDYYLLYLKQTGWTTNADNVKRMADNYLDVTYSLLEQHFTGYSVSYNSVGDVQIRFSAGSHYTPQETMDLRTASLSRAILVHDSLWHSGRLNGAMSQQDIARVYFEWLAENCEYDETSAPPSHQAFGLFVNHKAVCDGYVAAYNMLLKMEGIDCTIGSTDSHVWTVAELDGVTYHIDPTWGDSDKGIQYKYFCMSEEQSMARFK